MPDVLLDLGNRTLARVLVERRCAACGMWLTGGDSGHGSLTGLANGRKVCTGKGAGRVRRRVFLVTLSEREADQVARVYGGHAEYHPLLHWRRATPEERRQAVALAARRAEG